LERKYPMPKTKKPFVDFRAIRERLTMEQVLQRYGVLDTFKRSGTRLSGPCPIHGGSNPTQFRVDTERNLWNCFSECKHGGNVLDFIAKKEDIPIHDAAIRACEWFSIPLGEIEASNGKGEKSAKQPAHPRESGTDPEPRPVPTSEDNTPNPPLKFRLDKLQRDHPYLIDRGLSPETIAEFGLGFFAGEKGLMVGRVVIPIQNPKGEVVAYAGRWPGEPPKDTPKYKLPPGFRKGLELFNLDRAIKEPAEKPLLVVEGFFGAIKLHQHGCRKVVALMGSTMSAAQEDLLRQHLKPSSRVIIALDEDEAGRAGRENIAGRLAISCFVRVQRFATPGTQPEHLTPKDVHDLFGGAQ
jgi:DNA primase